MVDVITPEPHQWDAFVEARGGHLLQTSAWGDLKSGFGWSAERVALTNGDQMAAGALILYRPLPLSVGTIAYIPRGPVVDWLDQALLPLLMNAVAAAARRRKAIVLKIEPDLPDDPARRAELRDLGFAEAFQTIQPPRSIVIDVSGSDDEILSRMNQGTRRKIRTSEKKEIAIREGTSEDIESFARLMDVTGSRNTFGVHSFAYYQRAYDLFAPQGKTALFMASYEGRDLAGIMVFQQGEWAWYFYGASSNEERDRMPAYGLQWAAIQWARARGCRWYDLWGVPDADEDKLEADFQSRNDDLWGVYGFKRGFGGQLTRALGAWDLPLNPLLYPIYRAAFKARL